MSANYLIKAILVRRQLTQTKTIKIKCFGDGQQLGTKLASFHSAYEQIRTRKEDKRTRWAYERREIRATEVAPFAKEVWSCLGGQALGCRAKNGG